MQGPFTTLHMIGWNQAGYFPPQTLVRRGKLNDFIPIGSVDVFNNIQSKEQQQQQQHTSTKTNDAIFGNGHPPPPPPLRGQRSSSNNGGSVHVIVTLPIITVPSAKDVHVPTPSISTGR
jgi:hypothetical protein